MVGVTAVADPIQCVANDMAERYQRVTELIADVERLEFSQTGAPA